MRSLSVTSLAVLLSIAEVISATAHAADPDVEFFERKIRPALIRHCDECHAAGSKKLGGGLRLDHREGTRTGGDTGPALVPGKPDESLLIRAIRYDDVGLQMPPGGKLPADVIADLEEWVRRGAADPRERPAADRPEESWAATMRQRSDWWSLKPVASPAIPTPKTAGAGDDPVDQFLLSRLEAEGLSPAAEADPRTLARRLSLVLTGLPPQSGPTEELLRAASESPAAYRAALEQFVDGLLGSPHFGERWARHWLDVVRFSETHGNEWNYEVHHAWQYRDYLIRAFNADVPYDQFVREHIAGDLLPKPRWNSEAGLNESVIATAFYRFGEVNHDDCISLRSIGYDLADNQIDTLTKAFQATTVACARCHNHKLDAISTADYYALLGVLRSSRLVAHSLDSPAVNAAPIERIRQLKTGLRAELATAWLADSTRVPRYLAALGAPPTPEPAAGSVPPADGLDAARLAAWKAIAALDKVPLDDPLSAWWTLARATAGKPETFALEWAKLAEQVAREDREREEFNRANFDDFADLRHRIPAGWDAEGEGLANGASPSGEFAIHATGDTFVRTVLPAGLYTNTLSDKLNGTLRSPVLPVGPRRNQISFQVVGERSSAVRLVSNHCQLNYKNYRALASPDWQWITFSPPPDRDALRTYAELMTMFDNPKFPDQLSALGGDNGNYRLPWEKAAENPRSSFGVARVVFHDTGEPPRAELAHLRPLFAGTAPVSLAELSQRYADTLAGALRAWSEGRATDGDARWIDGFLRRGLLANSAASIPTAAPIIAEYRAAEAQITVPRVAPGIADGGPGISQPVFVRGDCERPGEAVPRRYLEVLSAPNETFSAEGSGRLELAERIASPGNPLTARVFVNRVWHHLFGTGLVRTVDDFGHVGELPSHPDLLDHLAGRFAAEGWSMKRLIRQLVLTRAFRQGSRPSDLARERDPLNRLLQHYPARRLDAEGVRDSLLASSGRLEPRLFGPSVQPFREKEYADRRLFPGPLDGDGRRSVYIKNNLMESPKFLGAFNTPGGKVAQGRRDITNVPAQALALLNDPFVLQQAEVWSKRVVAEPHSTAADRIDAMFRTALSRPPDSEERARFEQAVQRLAELHHVAPEEQMTSIPVWKDIAHALFNLSEFLYIP